MGWGRDKPEYRSQTYHERRFQAEMAESEVQRVVARFPHYPDPRTQTIEQLRFHRDRAYARAIAGAELKRRGLAEEVEALRLQVEAEARPAAEQAVEAQSVDAQRMKAWKSMLREERAPYWNLTHEGILGKIKEAENAQPRSGVLARLAHTAGMAEIERRKEEKLDPFTSPQEQYGDIDRAFA